MPVLEISLQSARTMLIIGGVLAGLGIAMLIISVAVFIAARAWFRAASGTLESPAEDDMPDPELLEMLGATETDVAADKEE